MSTLKFLPCPFCGASGSDIAYGALDGDAQFDGFDYVQCTECGAEIRAYRGDMPPILEAAEKWNQRAKSVTDLPIKNARECQYCGRKFLPDKEHIRYCSVECQALYYKAHPRYRECPFCSKIFLRIGEDFCIPPTTLSLLK